MRQGGRAGARGVVSARGCAVQAGGECARRAGVTVILESLRGSCGCEQLGRSALGALGRCSLPVAGSLQEQRDLSGKGEEACCRARKEPP